MAAAVRRAVLAAALAALPAAASEVDLPCSGSWENCSASMCCSTPYFECVEKTPPGYKHNGKVVKPYAQCRFANHSAGKSSCPCAKPPCVDYVHDYKEETKLPWSCVVLTGGCSPAFKPCGPGKNLDADAKRNYKGKPCCQWGCTCDYNVSWAAQCKPPKGRYACTKDAERETMLKNKDRASGLGDLDLGEGLDDLGDLFGITDSEDAPSVKAPAGLALRLAALAGVFGFLSLAALAAMALQRRRARAALSAPAVAVDAEADAAGLD